MYLKKFSQHTGGPGGPGIPFSCIDWPFGE